MATETAASETRRVDPWVIALPVLFLVCLALWPIEVDRVFGLPAHPLLLHVPVIFIPVCRCRGDRAVPHAGVAGGLRHRPGAGRSGDDGRDVPDRRRREAFENSRPFNEPGVALHADLARTLRWLVVGWVLAIVVLVVIDRILPRDRSSSALRVAALAVSGVVAVMSVLSVVWVIRTGHQGAKVTWQRGGGDGGGPPGFPGGGGDGPPGQSFPGGGQGGVPAPPGSGP